MKVLDGYKGGDRQLALLPPPQGGEGPSVTASTLTLPGQLNNVGLIKISEDLVKSNSQLNRKCYRDIYKLHEVPEPQIMIRLTLPSSIF
jgi:hypothetical protein